MDGIIANLQGVCDLADKYGAMVMVDDSHAVRLCGQARPGLHGALRRHGTGGRDHRHLR
ncbi:MAG: hypothetical protein ACLSHU_10385 [Oscillospiraceae bacterium]